VKSRVGGTEKCAPQGGSPSRLGFGPLVAAQRKAAAVRQEMVTGLLLHAVSLSSLNVTRTARMRTVSWTAYTSCLREPEALPSVMTVGPKGPRADACGLPDRGGWAAQRQRWAWAAMLRRTEAVRLSTLPGDCRVRPRTARPQRAWAWCVPPGREQREGRGRRLLNGRLETSSRSGSSGGGAPPPSAPCSACRRTGIWAGSGRPGAAMSPSSFPSTWCRSLRVLAASPRVRAAGPSPPSSPEGNTSSPTLLPASPRCSRAGSAGPGASCRDAGAGQAYPAGGRHRNVNTNSRVRRQPTRNGVPAGNGAPAPRSRLP